MDMNYNLYTDPRMAPGLDSNDDSGHQWPPNVCNDGSQQWQQPYGMDRPEDFSMHPQAYNRQPSGPTRPIPTPRATGYLPMHNIPYNQGYPEGRIGYSRMAPGHMNPRLMGPSSMGQGAMGHGSMRQGFMDQRSMGAGALGVRSMGQSMYASHGYSYNEASVLSQLHPVNEQLRSGPEVQRGVHQSMDARSDAAPQAQGKSAIDSADIPAKPLRAGESFKFSAVKTAAANPQRKRPFKRGATKAVTLPFESPKKRAAPSKTSPRKSTSASGAAKKKSTSESPAKTGKAKTNVLGGTARARARAVTASIGDVLRWRRQDFFSDADRASLIITVIGTMFDISGTAPVKITLHSQNENLTGVFWETELRLDRSAVPLGSLVRVVLRIPLEGDFHFLKVSPLTGPPGVESAYRRISYVTSRALEQSLRKA